MISLETLLTGHLTRQGNVRVRCRCSQDDRLARTRNEMPVVVDLQMVTKSEMLELTTRRQIRSHRDPKGIGELLFLDLASRAILMRRDQRR